MPGTVGTDFFGPRSVWACSREPRWRFDSSCHVCSSHVVTNCAVSLLTPRVFNASEQKAYVQNELEDDKGVLSRSWTSAGARRLYIVSLYIYIRTRRCAAPLKCIIIDNYNFRRTTQILLNGVFKRQRR